MLTTCKSTTPCKTRVFSALKCKCGECFCPKHKDPVDHQCSFDYKGYEKVLLEKKNPLISSNTTDRS